MKKYVAGFILLSVMMTGVNAQQDQLIGARFPSLSPDASQIAFSYMGDIWVVSSEGGQATRLTNHTAYEREPVWSPDGTQIAFTSNRTGNNDIFLIPVSGGEPEQITFHTSSDVATDFSPDGRWIYFTSGRTSSAGTWQIPIGGGNALPVLETHWSRPYDARVHPDGEGILFSLGWENGSKWRRGYRGANSATIWFMGSGEEEAQLLVQDESNSFWPAWGPSGDRIYFVSDREFGNSNIWSAARDGSDQQPVTRFRRNDIRWMRMAKNVPVAAYERDFGIWLTDLETGRSEAVQIDAPNEMKENRTVTLSNESVSEFRVSPDGKKIAAVIRGEIFVLSTDGDYARNITNSPWRERDIAWGAESRRIIYVSDPEANPDLYIISALGNSDPTRLTRTSDDVLGPLLSPDGEWIAYYHGHRQIRLIRPDGSGDRLLVEDDFGGRFGEPTAAMWQWFDRDRIPTSTPSVSRPARRWLSPTPLMMREARYGLLTAGPSSSHRTVQATVFPNSLVRRISTDCCCSRGLPNSMRTSSRRSLQPRVMKHLKVKRRQVVTDLTQRMLW